MRLFARSADCATARHAPRELCPGKLHNKTNMPKHQLCRNCGHEIDHNYCPACGQRTTTDRLTWASLVDSVSSTFIGDEAYGLRGINMRKGAVMTWLAILIHPYVSVSEFILGHRRKYFNPVAILLMLSTFYAVVFALVSKEFTPTARATPPCSGGLSAPTTTTPRCTPRPTCC